MERYTSRDENGVAYIPGYPQTHGLTAIEKFAQYEDTGATPEECLETKAELARLTTEVTRLAIDSIEREKQLAKLEAEVQHWADAEKDGRMVVLPCKVGDVVYWASHYQGGVREGVVTDINVSKFGFDLRISQNGGHSTTVRREVEKTFSTREAAEAALEAAGKE